MGIILTQLHHLVFPSGLVQEVEFAQGQEPQTGDILASEQIGATIEPGGKYLIRRIVDQDPGEYPHVKRYFLERF